MDSKARHIALNFVSMLKENLSFSVLRPIPFKDQFCVSYYLSMSLKDLQEVLPITDRSKAILLLCFFILFFCLFCFMSWCWIFVLFAPYVHFHISGLGN